MLYPALRQVLFRMDPEMVHHWALACLRQGWWQGFGARPPSTHAPALKRTVWGLNFPNPVGLAAGFDKNAVALPAWERLGFGFVEVGTVTRHPQPGNPRPRIFRLPQERALINRMGFPNEGAESVAHRLHELRDVGRWPSIPVGINLGKSKVTPLEEAGSDYTHSLAVLREFADYFVINVSSPNTPGLRGLQDGDQLRRLLGAVQEENHRHQRRPLLVKIAPDLNESQLDEVLQVMLEQGADGIVATNTTLDHSSVSLREQGGLSGRPLQSRSTEVIRMIHGKTGGRLPIIGAGGIFSAAEAQAKLEAGAVLVQGYTGFIYEGPGFASALCRGLMDRCPGEAAREA